VSFGTGSSSSILLMGIITGAIVMHVVEGFLLFLVSLTKALTGLIDGSFVRHGTPVTGRSALFQKATSLLFHRLHNRLTDEQLGVLGASSVQWAIGADQAAVPFVTGVMIGHATATAENILKDLHVKQ
jgi:hypothetical protein